MITLLCRFINWLRDFLDWKTAYVIERQRVEITRLQTALDQLVEERIELRDENTHLKSRVAAQNIKEEELHAIILRCGERRQRHEQKIAELTAALFEKIHDSIPEQL